MEPLPPQKTKKQMVGVTIDTTTDTTSQRIAGVTSHLADSFQGKWAGDVREKLGIYQKELDNF
ncbi:hypothetical protein PROCOU_00320 [Listeria rocourtiae FSL F6-920]|nr:hypothetical protein PROCOU_00320 [Listeria rocourtiae FSL F6-920]